MPNNIPDVIPLQQFDSNENGEVVSKKVKPLTYALMTWIKAYKGLEDTINIADDENSAECEISYENKYDLKYSTYFNTYEEPGLIFFYIYYFEKEISPENLDTVKEIVLEKNNNISTGCFQLVTNDTILRYRSAINVSGLASEDPEYSGPHLISPKLIDNLFNDGIQAMDSFMPDFMELAYPEDIEESS